MKKLPLYAIPGLGVDGRIFGKLELDRPLHILEWIDPQPQEPLAAYAQRLALALPREPLLLLGLSFGGVVARELVRHYPVRGVILLSSIKNPSELPWKFRLMRKVPYYRLSRGNWRIRSLPFWGPLFGIHKREEQKLLQTIFEQFDVHYRMWAIHQLINWSGNADPVPLFHIHGTRDKVFPRSFVQADHWVEGGNHFMVYQRADEISGLIVDKCREWESNN
jgi:pimeloyl-ACP methyl ester carboxylesterase